MLEIAIMIRNALQNLEQKAFKTGRKLYNSKAKFGICFINSFEFILGNIRKFEINEMTF